MRSTVCNDVLLLSVLPCKPLDFFLTLNTTCGAQEHAQALEQLKWIDAWLQQKNNDKNVIKKHCHKEHIGTF